MVGYGGKDLQKRKLLSLEWKSEGAMHRPLRAAGSVHLPGVRPSLSVCLSVPAWATAAKFAVVGVSSC